MGQQLKGKQIADKSISQQKLALTSPVLQSDPVTLEYFLTQDFITKALITNKLSFGNFSQFASTFDETLDSFYLTESRKEGLFKYDPTDITSAQDNAMVLVKNGKRFKRQHSGIINAGWWDLKGNGVDDTVEFKKALSYVANNGGTLFIPDGVFSVVLASQAPDIIVVNPSVKQIIITGTGTLKTRKGYTGNAAPAAISLKGHMGCDVLVQGVKIIGSRDTETDEYDQIINNLYVSHSARTRLHGFGICLISFNNVFVESCDIKTLHGFAVFSGEANFFSVTNCKIHDISRSAISSANLVLNLFATGNRVTDIGVLKDTFTVWEGNPAVPTVYQFENDPSGKVWYTDIGDGIYHLGPTMHISNNYFKNINRIAICTDIKDLAVDSYLLAADNIIEHDNVKLRCSNPQSSIWIEKAHSAAITNNTIRYINRAPSEALAGYAIVCAVSTRLECNFLIENNSIFSENHNKDVLVGIKTINNSGSVIVRNNRAYGKFFACAYHSNVSNPSGIRHLEQLVYDGNNFTNIFDNPTVSAFAYDSAATDGGGIPWIKRYYFTNNIINVVNKTRTNANPYASIINVVKGNDFDGTGIDLRNYNYPDKCLYIEDNKNVKSVIPKNGIPTEDNFYYIRRNEFLGALNLSTASGIYRVSGEVKGNTVEGRVYVNSFNDLTIESNRIKGDGITFNNPGKSSFGARVLNNYIQLATDKIGVYFNNSNKFTYQDVTVQGNTFGIQSGATNTTGVKFLTAGEKVNLDVQANSYKGITDPLVNTNTSLEIRATLPFNIKSMAAGETYVTPGSTVLGAKMGQVVKVAMDIDLGGLNPVQAYVSAPDLIKFVVHNPTTGVIDLPLGNVNIILT